MEERISAVRPPDGAAEEALALFFTALTDLPVVALFERVRLLFAMIVLSTVLL
jgi:hypothetical protein